MIMALVMSVPGCAIGPAHRLPSTWVSGLTTISGVDHMLPTCFKGSMNNLGTLQSQMVVYFSMVLMGTLTTHFLQGSAAIILSQV